MNESKLSAVAAKYALEPQEISKIASVLELPEIKEVAALAEEARKFRRKAMLFSFVGTYMACFALFTGIESGIPAVTRAFISIFPSLVAVGIAYFVTKGDQNEKLKRAVLSKFFETFAPGASYSPGGAHSPAYAHLVSEGFLSSYDRVEREEDSFCFKYLKNGKGIDVSGMELETSEMRGSGKNRRRVTTNKCVIMRGDYPDTRFEIEKSVRIRGDVADSTVLKLLSFAVPAGFAWAWLGGANGRAVLDALSGIPHVQEIAAIAIGAVSWFIAGWAANHNRVKLENVRFEKLFDVKSEDQIVSRMLVTPALMDRIVEFVNKNGGKYEFLFQGKTLYLKKELNGGYLEVDSSENIEENGEMFAKWYSQLKETVSLIADTGVLVFSRTDYSALASAASKSVENPVSVLR